MIISIISEISNDASELVDESIEPTEIFMNIMWNIITNSEPPENLDKERFFHG